LSELNLLARVGFLFLLNTYKTFTFLKTDKSPYSRIAFANDRCLEATLLDEEYPNCFSSPLRRGGMTRLLDFRLDDLRSERFGERFLERDFFRVDRFRDFAIIMIL